MKNHRDIPKVKIPKKNPCQLCPSSLNYALFVWSFNTIFSDKKFLAARLNWVFIIITDNYYFIISVDSMLNKFSCNNCLRMLELSLISPCLRNKTTIKSLFRPKFVTRSRNQTFWNVWDQNYLPWLVTQNFSTLRNQFLKPLCLRVG